VRLPWQARCSQRHPSPRWSISANIPTSRVSGFAPATRTIGLRSRARLRSRPNIRRYSKRPRPISRPADRATGRRPSASRRDSYRRIYTDGRDWPADVPLTFAGYSIGKWIDQDGDGRYDVLEIETRFLKGPRGYDTSGLPFHSDNKTVIKERIYLDKTDRDTLYDEITVIDHAMTRPYSKQKATRNPDPRPLWLSDVCSENNTHVRIGAEHYFLSADGKLMPSKKNQAPPDLSYFKQAR
jgi:hypothetical protein